MDKRSFRHKDHAETSSSRPPKRRKASNHDLGNVVHESRKGSTSIQHDHYSIAWICALHIELETAWAMLDDIHDPLPQSANDSNTYTLGSINHHNIIITCLPAAQYGTNNASSVLNHLMYTFPSIRLCLTVGIGGGVPSQVDVRLGDIVVGTRVMLYDLKKTDNVQETAIPKILDQFLGTAVSALRSKHELEPSRVPSILQEKLGGLPEHGRPSSPDRLFYATYDHESPIASCDGCDRSMLAPRRRRISDNVQIHYGGIASGNQVMRSGTTRDELARQLDVICFETETADLMNNMPYLPIRGICDYSDSHKGKEWQKFAAATAAAYARELLEELPVAKVHAGIDCIPNPLQLRVTAAHSRCLDPSSSHEHRQGLLKSLKFEQIDSRQSTIEKPHGKTCQWFLNHPDHQAWLDPGKVREHSGFLWIMGKPGAGKSIIMKFAYMQSKARHKPAITAGFFFNARGEYLERSILGMYRSLLLQLLEGYPDLQTVLDDPDLVSQSQSGCPSLNVLKDLFRNAVSALGQRSFTCFIDALDECNEQQAMDTVQYFEGLAEQSLDKGVPLRVCFSSQHNPHIVIQQGNQLILEDQPGHTEDLAQYVASHLRITDRTLVEELQPKLVSKAGGIFLWVVLVVDILNKESERGRIAIRKRLVETPSSLNELFKDLLRRDNKNMEELLLCILWILYAKRPLRPEEYYHALWSGLSLKNLADPEIPIITDSEGSDIFARYIISSSKGLAKITKAKQPTVQFIHESVRDFLLKDGGLHELWPDLGFNRKNRKSRNHNRLKEFCDSYMNHQLLHASMNGIKLKTTEISKWYPFLEYASQNVLYHANAAADAVPQDHFLSRFPVSNWISLINLFEKFKIRQYSPDASLFYLLADKGFSELIRTRLEDDPHVHVLGERYGYPLFAALANGNKDAVAALLNSPSSICNGVDITEGLNCREDLKRYKNRTPLSWAAQDGRVGIVKLLLQTVTTVNDVDRGGQTSLSRASENGHEAVARLLIEKGADVNARDNSGFTPLSLASRNGHETVTRLLIDKGANINARDNDGITPLSLALQNAHEALARLLIDKGAEVNASDAFGSTLLLEALEKSHEARQNDMQRDEKVHFRRDEGTSQLLHCPILPNCSLAPSSNFWTDAEVKEHVKNCHPGRRLDPTLAPPTDSGYASAPGMESEINKSENHGDQAATQSMQERTEQDVSDTATEYSNTSSAMFSRQQTYIWELADDLFRRIGSLNADEKTQGKVSAILPELLKAFALKIGHDAPTQMHRDVMAFVHRHRRRVDCSRGPRDILTAVRVSEIAAAFTDMGIINEEDNIEQSTPDSNAMGPEERVSRWLRDESIEEAGQEEECQMSSSATPTFVGVGDAEDEDESEPEPEPEPEPDNWLNAYREFVFSTDAFKWLLARLRKEINLVHTEPNTIQVIRERIISSLPIPHKISRKLPSYTYSVRFDLEWDIFQFFKAQKYLKPPDEVLEGVITLTGSCLDAQAATCAQYMHQTWPLAGEATLQLVKDILRDGKCHSSVLADGTKLSAWISNSRFIAEAYGVSDSVAETGEQLAWLGAALTTSTRQNKLVYCTPIISKIVQNNTPSPQVGFQSSSIDLTCRIEFTTEEVPQAPGTINGQCWHDFFKNPVVVRGYPIPKRMEWATGLEIPINIMARLARSQQVDRFKDKVYIKGFSTMLVPTRQNQDILYWHLIYNRNGGRISYLDDFIDQNPQFTHCKLESLENIRHVLGWCSKVQFNAGSTLADYPPVAHSCLPEPRKGGALTNTYVYRGQTIEESSCQLGAKDTPVRETHDPYHERLNWISTKFVLLWDEHDKRGWLINGTSALLHVVRASLAHDGTKFRSSWAFKSKDLQVPDGPFMANSSIDLLNIPENLDLALFRKDKNSLLRSRVEYFCNVLEKLIDHQADIAGNYGVKMSSMPRTCLEGWDFEDLAMRIDRLPSRAAKLKAHGKAWVDFTRAIQAVTLVGSGFGDIIQPNNPDICSDWAKLPKHQYYIAMCVSDFSRVVKKHGFHDDGRIRLSDSLIWHTPKTIFESCQCSGASNQGGCDPVQTVFPLALSSELPEESRRSNRRQLILGPAEDKGALIFGHNADFSWVWEDAGHPKKCNLEGPGSPSDSGIGSTLTTYSSDVQTNTTAKRYPRYRYTVGIICALSKELKAVRALFDTPNATPETPDGDDCYYAAGQMARHMVVAACLPTSGYGITQAAKLALNMKRSFSGLQFCLLVGIGGGVPSEQNDIRLGDVVVGIPQGIYSGVFQHDFGKEKGSSGFERTGWCQGPPDSLTNAISFLQSDPKPTDDPLREHLDKISSTIPPTDDGKPHKYRHPGQELDKLFETCSTCPSSQNDCPRGGSHVRQRGPRPTNKPMVHFGLVASGNCVVKDAAFRDDLAREQPVMCVEMEAAGVVNTFPCLVIRGICDYCDVHKNDDWQEYAAATAAAYAKHLLSETRVPKRGRSEDEEARESGRVR
ncbi:unnamed protein product [Clonostachys byssicola]|uniref:Nucleoside phosphorylase domain-containing protein n=1 Tax=Clonostachys byssicola TaxID=160290 RepID=A0A9N9Y6C3_9HYPO|nr:unnamed protein product [Clonostachys byssicola]